jgi:hypothetical protein
VTGRTSRRRRVTACSARRAEVRVSLIRLRARCCVQQIAHRIRDVRQRPQFVALGLGAGMRLVVLQPGRPEAAVLQLADPPVEPFRVLPDLRPRIGAEQLPLTPLGISLSSASCSWTSVSPRFACAPAGTSRPASSPERGCRAHSGRRPWKFSLNGALAHMGGRPAAQDLPSAPCGRRRRGCCRVS